MTPEEVDRLAELCSQAAQSEKGLRLYAAIVTDGVFEGIVRGQPNPGAIAEEMGNDRIIEVTTKELEAMSDTDRNQLMEDALQHLGKLIGLAGKSAFKAMKNGILDSDDLTPELLSSVAAVYCVANATK